MEGSTASPDLAPASAPNDGGEYRKPEVRDYGRIEPVLQFSPPPPP